MGVKKCKGWVSVPSGEVACNLVWKFGDHLKTSLKGSKDLGSNVRTFSGQPHTYWVVWEVPMSSVALQWELSIIRSARMMLSSGMWRGALNF